MQVYGLGQSALPGLFSQCIRYIGGRDNSTVLFG
ncbi:uncharacterized protein CPUR_08134 [Claviceps purpurea 20.1]|uniref:Uncharacterized protein n=1 Tax=Claviceps purpurea (strain 20.1) TaxID=1111077 RepID=M1VYM8_CLAP2|nr:uncharacterized protein CPUR_08134 [Claviceps purpurea 20.1]